MRPLESPVLSYFTKNEYAISFFILFFLLFALPLLNKKLKKEVNFYYKAAKQFRKDKDVLMKENEELEKENKELKEKLEKLRTDNIYEEWLYE